MGCTTRTIYHMIGNIRVIQFLFHIQPPVCDNVASNAALHSKQKKKKKKKKKNNYLPTPSFLTIRFNKISTQGAPQMAVDKEAINSLSRVYSYYSKFNYRCLFYI